jgi:Icc protein
MPVHLPPLSRRAFLRRLLLAGLALGTGHRLRATSWDRRDLHLWALMADTHIAAERSRMHGGIAMADHLKVTVDQVLAQPSRPGGCLIAGDLAYSQGETGDYQVLSSLLAPLRASGVPVHLALGNHDHRDRFLEALPWAVRLDRPLRSYCCAVVPSPRANWFVLDSLEETLVTPGRLGPEQLAWLAGALDQRRRRPAIVVLHHHPDLAPKRLGLKDTEAFLAVIRPRTQVKACVFGHTHRWGLAEDESGIHLINLPPTAYVFRPEFPSGWIQARLRADGMDLRLWCIDERHPQHGQTASLSWRPD